MKKTITILLVLLVLLPIFAYQEIYGIDSWEVKTFRSLNRICGVGYNVVEPTYPITGSQLLHLVKAMDSSRFSGFALEEYNKLVSVLENKTKSVDWSNGITSFELSAKLNPVFYFRTSEGEISYDLLYNDIPSRKNYQTIGATLWLGDWFSGKFSADQVISTSPDTWNSKVSNNLPYKNQDNSQPFSVWTSFGNGLYNISAGRENLSAGKGISGNLFLTDNFVYNDFVKLSAVGDVISYDMTLMTFDKEQFDPSTNKSYLVSPDFNSESIFVINHRCSLSLFKYVTISLYEAMLEYGDNIFQHFTILNPFFILHNNNAFSPGNNNNLFGVELSANLPHGFDFNLQIMVDQIQGKDEIEGSEGIIPSSSGAGLASIIWSGNVGEGILDSWIEGVYVSPVCYLKEKTPRMNPNGYQWWQSDLLVGNDIGGCNYFQYLGYPLGPNTIALNVGSEYRTEKFSVKGDIRYSVTGTYKKGDWIDTTWEYFYATSPLCIGEGKVPESSFVVGLSGEYTVCPGLSLIGSAARIAINNYQNTENSRFEDNQFSIGIKFDGITLAKNGYSLLKSRFL